MSTNVADALDQLNKHTAKRKQAYNDLRAWAQNNARRNDVILTALAADISTREIQEITGVARTTISRISRDIA